MNKIKFISNRKPLIIAGPCSAESKEQLFTTAKAISQHVDLFRVGIWKPRTSPDSFQGLGNKALKWIQELKNQIEIPIATEVANAGHVESCLKSEVDVIWLGARTTVNPFYVQEIAEALRGVDIPVLIKNPIHPELSLWIGAIERLRKVGINNLAAIHRGFFTLEKSAFRNEPKWEIPIKLKKECPDLPLLCDPSHISGNIDMIQEVSQTALDLDMDGLMIETHFKPSVALSDANQQITPIQLLKLKKSLVLRKTTALNKDFNNKLYELRKLIDQIDEKLVKIIGNRVSLVKEIGAYKKKNKVTILQIKRWFEIFNTRQKMGVNYNVDPQYVAEIFELIHKHSILTQTELMKKSND